MRTENRRTSCSFYVPLAMVTWFCFAPGDAFSKQSPSKPGKGGGNGGTESRWVEPRVLDDAIKTKKIPPLIIISAHAPSGTIWTDSKDGVYPVETMVVKDLVAYVDETYRTIATRAARWIEGFSVGGRGSAHI